ncbi:MAG: hypothetical protein ABI690_29885 [Chloroflexota bacterium]
MSQPDPGFDPKTNKTNKRSIMVDGQPVDMDTFMQMQSGVGGPIPVPKRRRSGGCGIGIIVLALVIIVPVVIIFVVVGGALTSGLGGLGAIGDIVATVQNAIKPPETRPVSGDASRFDPLAGLVDAQDFAGADAKLATITATYVRADGTMDLTATYSPAPRTEYTFLREVPRPTDAPPVGVAGSTKGPWFEPITIQAYRPGQTSHVTSTGSGINTEYDYTNQGFLKDVDDPTTTPSDEIAPEPTCKFVDLWKAAMKQGAPEEAVAIIEYNSQGYSFRITGSISLNFDMNCKLLK